MCFLIFFVTSGFQSFANSINTQYYLKVVYDGVVIFHDKVDAEKFIQVKDHKDRIIQSEVLRSETTLELEKPETPQGYVFSYWDIQNNSNNFILKPVFIQAKAINLSFIAEEGGFILKNNTQTSLVNISVDEGKRLIEILPQTNPKKNYKFSGWYTYDNNEFQQITNLESVINSSSKQIYYALFYPDLNDNNIDDRTEKVTVKFVYNIGNKVEEKSLNVGQSIELPSLEQKGYILLGWYYDKEFQKKFDSDTLIIDDITLYAKWEKAEKVISDNKENLITDEEISKQIENFLKEMENEIKQAIKPDKNDSNNINGTNFEDSIFFPNENILSDTDNITYVFYNENVGLDHLIKFYDHDGHFLFSTILPYGRFIELYDQNGNIVKEFAVRQDSSIYINPDELINPDTRLKNFDSFTVRKNAGYVTEIHPIYEIASTQIKDQTTENDSSPLLTIISILLIIIVIISIILFIKRKKQIENLNYKGEVIKQ